MKITMPAPPPERLHPKDWTELRSLVRSTVRAEVERAIEARGVGAVEEARPEYAAGASTCRGGCIGGWRTCLVCVGGALVTFSAGERRYVECGTCSGSGRPGFLPCPVCAEPIGTPASSAA